ncbi:MAG: hypothetical protein ACXABH_09270, partial [Candidatus Thorarchaeota archaeon]
MKNIRRTIIGMFLLVALLGTMTNTATAMGGMDGPMDNHMPGMPHHDRMSDGSVVVNTDIITIEANDERPQFHFWYTGDVNGSRVRFSTSYVMLVEFEDLNDDGAFQRDEYLHFAPLAAFEWTLTTGEVVDGDVVTEV